MSRYSTIKLCQRVCVSMLPTIWNVNFVTCTCFHIATSLRAWPLPPLTLADTPMPLQQDAPLALTLTVTVDFVAADVGLNIAIDIVNFDTGRLPPPRFSCLQTIFMGDVNAVNAIEYF